MPLKADEAKYENGKVEIAAAVLEAATEGSKISLVVTYDRKEDGKVVDTVKLEKTLDVLTGKELVAKPVDIEKVVAKVGEEELDLDKELAPDTEVELTPIVLDQYGNEFTTEDNTVRWAITEGADLVSFLVKEGDTEVESDEKVLTAKTVKYVAKAPGKVVITAFNQSNGKKATHEITIGEVDINKLTYTLTEEEKEAAASAINFEEAALGTITFNKGADLQPEDVKYKVTETKDGKEVDASAKVEIKTAWKEVAEGQEPTEMTVTATAKEEGTYKITPYAVNEKGKEVVAETPATLTSTKHADVKTVELLDVEKENVLKVTEPKTAVTKELVFKNKYDEPIEPDFAKDNEGNVIKGKIEGLTINSSNDGLLEVSGVTKTEATEEKDAKYTIELTPKKAGEAVLTLQGIGKPVVYNFTLEGSVLTEAKVEKESLEPMIAGDTVEVKGEDGTVTNETKAQYNKLTLHDQDGDQMPDLANNTEYKFEVYDSKGNKVEAVEQSKFGLAVVNATEDEEGNIVESSPATDESAKYVKVAPTEEAKAGKYTVKVIAQAENKDEKLKEVAAEFKLEVKEARKAKELKVDPTSTNIALDGQAKVLVTLTDQYGEPFALKDGKDIKVTVKDLAEDATSPFNAELLKATSVEGEVGQYEFTVKPVVDSGQYTLVVSYEVEEATTDKKAVVIEEEVTVTVGVGAELVKSLEIENEKNEIVDGKATYLYKANGTDKKKPFTLVAKDENGEIVNIDTAGEGITWHSSNPDVATVGKDGKVTTKELPENTEETVEVWADYYGAVTTEKVTIVVSNKEEKIQPNTLQATVPVKVDGKDKDQIVTEVVIDENAPNGTITLTYTGTDQYGDSKDAIDFSTLQIPNTAVATAEQLTDDEDKKTNKVKITAVKEDKTNIRTVIDGAELNLPIIVKKEAVVIAQDAKTLETAKATIEALNADGNVIEVEGKDLEPSVAKVKDAIQEKLNDDSITVEVTEVEEDKTRSLASADDTKVGEGQSESSNEGTGDDDGGTGETDTPTTNQKTYNVTLSKGKAKLDEFPVTVEFVLTQEAADQEAVETALGKVENEYEVPFGTEGEGIITAVQDAVTTDIDNEDIKVSVAKAEADTLGKYTVTLKKGKAVKTKDVTVKEAAEKLPGVTISNETSTEGTDKVDGAKATAAVYTFTLSGETVSEGTLVLTAGGKTVEVKVTTEMKDLQAVARAVATAIENETGLGFTAEAKDDTVVLTATTEGVTNVFDNIKLADKVQESEQTTSVTAKGEVTTEGKAKVEGTPATPATYTFTVSKAKHPGTIKVTVDGKTVEVEIAEDKLTAEGVAAAIAAATFENADVTVDDTDKTKLTFTAKETGKKEGFKVAIADKSSKEDTLAADGE